jgi:hypothetical protein
MSAFFACIVVPDPWMLCRILAAFGLPERHVSVLRLPYPSLPFGLDQVQYLFVPVLRLL